MMQVIERVEAHYEIQETPYGTSYRWWPECLLIECDCGERVECKSPTDHCRCGADCAAVFEGQTHEHRVRQEAPWRQEEYLWPTERDYWLELRALE
ncbi:MAG: hypothetical protein H0X71_09475 [Rubrobacter sp.]|nr:hypothetical protein [Rubrobacter sp.]